MTLWTFFPPLKIPLILRWFHWIQRSDSPEITPWSNDDIVFDINVLSFIQLPHHTIWWIPLWHVKSHNTTPHYLMDLTMARDEPYHTTLLYILFHQLKISSSIKVHISIFWRHVDFISGDVQSCMIRKCPRCLLRPTLVANEMESLLKFAKPKRLMGLEVHQDGFQSANSLQWQNAVASVR